jgi:hypothetical protein
MVQSNGDDPQLQSGGAGNGALDGAPSQEPQLGGNEAGSSFDGAEGNEPGEPKARVYSEAEWNKRQSELDKQINEFRGLAGRATLELQAEQARNVEAMARAQDARLVEDGDLTQADANQRAYQRQADLQLAQQRQQEVAGHQRLMAHGEQLGRAIAAQDYAQEFGVDVNELLADASLTGPDAMRLKARELSLDARENKARAEGPQETYDGGGGGNGGGSGSVDNLSPEEKVRYGLNHPPRRR